MVTVPVPASRTPFLAPVALPVLQARIVKCRLTAVTKEMTQNPRCCQVCASLQSERPRKQGPGAWHVKRGWVAELPARKQRKNKLFVPAPSCEHMIATLMSAHGCRRSQTVLGSI